MANVPYLWEQVQHTVYSLCNGDGPFVERLGGAWASRLSRLTPGDPPAEIADKLNDVLRTINSHIGGGRIAPFTEDERNMICGNLVAILIWSSRQTGGE